MSVLELRTEIERKAEEEASRIVANAREEAEKITGEAKTRAQALRDEKTKSLKRVLEAEEKAELAVSRMEQKGRLLQLKSEWAIRVFDEAGRRLVGIAEKGGLEYREYLSKLILEGIKKTKGDEFIVEANARDVEMIKKELKGILEKAGKIKNAKVELEVKSSPAISSGGVIVSTEDLSQYYNNTLDARLSQAQQRLSGEAYKIIFEMGE